ncbi:MAG: hypothetical protein NZ895_02355 [Archaeoglobaceae archaeon]|nr:hypothetical protein [Archaeoglobaceae archaeon]MCX8152198.1 hypothetical protein [Archaeoglobaceae archaeon]MDW8013914.1 hypothetical protein [Archaeoglobaceae archaeon]
MKFAVLSLGLEKIAETISSEYKVDLLNSFDFDFSSYDFVVVTFELGSLGAENFLRNFEKIKCEVLVFCTMPSSLEKILVGREQAERVLSLNFEGAIISCNFSFEEKIFALRELINSKYEE